jgi:hypothetical protein
VRYKSEDRLEGPDEPNDTPHLTEEYVLAEDVLEADEWVEDVLAAEDELAAADEFLLSLSSSSLSLSTFDGNASFTCLSVTCIELG